MNEVFEKNNHYWVCENCNYVLKEKKVREIKKEVKFKDKEELEKKIRDYFLKNYNFNISNYDIDLNSLLDENLSFNENVEIVLNEVKGLEPDKFLEYDEEMAKHLEEEMAKRESEYYRKEFERRIEKLKKNADLSILNFYPENFKPLVDMVIKGFVKTLFIIGETGCGKTFNLNILLPTNTVRIGGHITPYKLYSILYENRENKILLFDDTEDMLKSDEVLSILKQALDTTEPRKVNWISSRNEKINLPKEFIFNSRIIFVVNKVPKDFEAIMSRSNVVEINPSYWDYLQMMYCIAKNPIEINGVKITPEERIKIVDFIKENSDETTKNFNLRTQFKIECYYAYDKKNWKKYAKFLLSKKDDLLQVVKKLMESGKPISEQIKEFNKLYHKSRATFYRYRKKLLSHISSKKEYV